MFKKILFTLILLGTVGVSYSQKWVEFYELSVDDFSKGDNENAIINCEKALTFAKKEIGNNHQDYAKILFSLGYLNMLVKNYEKAEAFYLESIEVYAKSLGKESAKYADGMFNLADMYEKIFNVEKAESCYLKVIEIYRKILGEGSTDFVTLLSNMGEFYKRVGKYNDAERLFLEALALEKKYTGEKHLGYGILLNNLATLYLEMGQYELVEPLYLKVISIQKVELGKSDPSYANSLNNLATTYLYQGKYDKAEPLFIESIAITKMAFGDNHLDYGSRLKNLATLYFKMGLFNKSENLFIEASAIIKQQLGEIHAEYANILNSMGALYMKMNENDRAEALFKQSTEIRKKVLGENHPDYAMSLSNLGSFYVEQGQYEKAEPLLLEAIGIRKSTLGEFNPNYAESLHNLGGLYYRMRQYEKAEPFYVRAIEIKKQVLGETHPGYAMSITNFAALYSVMGQYDKAAPLYELSKNILLQNIKQNFSFLSETEKEKYVATVAYYFSLYQSFYANYYKQTHSIVKSAIDVNLVTQGMILNAGTKIQGNILNSEDSVMVDLNDDWRTCRIRISEQYSKPITERNLDLKKWEDEANRIEKELTKLSSNFANHQKSFQLNWTDIQLGLKENEAAVEFIYFPYFHNDWTDSVMYAAIIIRKNDSLPIYVPLFEEKHLKGLFRGDSVRTFANLLYTDAQVRTEEHDISYGDSLYQLIWQPIEPFLKNVSQIYYSPSGLLHNITFDAIPMKDQLLLSDKYNLRRVTTTAKALEKDSVNFTPVSISLFGGIKYDLDTIELKKLANQYKGDEKESFYFSNSRSFQDSSSRGGFKYLTGSKIEVENIEELFKKNKITTQVYSEQYGTEEAVKRLDIKNSPSILHFSTHGFFFPDPVLKKEDLNKRALDHDIVFKYSDNPLFRSGLIMAGAEYVWKGNEAIEGVEDGILTAYEVSNLYLPNTKLVVMSACETGLGDIKGSEGVYGLQRAFKMAGVEYIIMTLWQVLDKETSDFMILFYQNMITKKSIPDAFKAAQDVMKNKYREEPYKWAGFVLIK